MSTNGSQPLLKVDNLESFYGPIMAIRGVSLSVNQGQIVTVLGANGAGKNNSPEDDFRSHGSREGNSHSGRQGYSG